MRYLVREVTHPFYKSTSIPLSNAHSRPVAKTSQNNRLVSHGPHEAPGAALLEIDTE